ncbi:flagellar hook-associated protein 2 [Metabacillus sp. RGM 3146]|uniref:flagellar hook-associated protein 2 n=1 Tax=Metabacillus sp. RGM 3146 TaxID=3401092 RepID=UPI003B99DB9D
MTTRISGLASGMDIDQMVSDLMKVERVPLDKMKHNKQTLEWQRDDYRDMNKLLNDLDQQIFNGIGMQSSFLKKSVTSSDDSKVSAKAINAASNFTSSVEVTQLASSASWVSDKAPSFTAGTATELTFNVMDPGTTAARTVSISISATDTIDNVISKINSSSLGVSAMNESIQVGTAPDPKDNTKTIPVYDQRIVFTNNQTGKGASISTTDPATKTFLSNLGFDTSSDALKVTDGQNAVVKLNGFQMEKSSNTFTVNGVEYTLKQPTTGPVSVSSTTDVDSILDTITQFVAKYNDTIDKINSKVSEDRNRDYPPLTDDQRTSLTDTQQQQWEEKAKSGMLRNDTLLTGGLNSLRTNMYAPVNSSTNISGYNQLSEIGITTSPNYQDKGKLIIDETKLRQKIQENPNAIYQLFNADGGTDDTKGIGKRLRDSIKDTITKVENKAGNTLMTSQSFTIGKNLTDLDTQINDFNARMTQVEDRYYRQFTAMETAISKANQQSAYITNNFGGGQ